MMSLLLAGNFSLFSAIAPRLSIGEQYYPWQPPQVCLFGHDTGGAAPFMIPGAPLNMVSKSDEPQSGHGMRFSALSAIDAEMLCSLLHFVQRKS